MTQAFSQDQVDEVFDWIVAYKEAHGGESPSLRDISEGVEFADGTKPAGASSVTLILDRLEDEGRIERVPGKHRHIKIPGSTWLYSRRVDFSLDGVRA